MQEITGEYYLSNSEIKLSNKFCEDFLKLDTYIYEVMRVIKGVPMFIEDHLERLAQTAKIQNTKLPYSAKEISRQINLLIDKNKFLEGNIKIVFIPEAKSKCEYNFLIYINPHQYPTEDEFANGVAVSLFSGVRVNPNAKIMQTELRNEANLHKSFTNTYEVLLVDEHGYITEGSRSNVFFIRENEIITPPTSDVLPGITRKYVIKLAQNLNVKLIEERVSVNDIKFMEGVFISGTSKKILPVNKIEDNVFISNHKITKQLQNAFNDLCNNYINKFNPQLFF